jgi:hypothetical protein
LVVVAAGRKVTSGPAEEARARIFLGVSTLSLVGPTCLARKRESAFLGRLGALATDVLGRPGLVDLAALALGEL